MSYNLYNIISFGIFYDITEYNISKALTKYLLLFDINGD